MVRNDMNKWTEDSHARQYLERADDIKHRREGEAVLLAHLPHDLRHVLDLGTGDGRLLALVKEKFPQATGVALDFSSAMLEAARKRFKGDSTLEVIEHNLDLPLPELGSFDAVVSSFAIHHCSDARKHSLYREIFPLLEAGGVFCNLEHVSSPTPRLHDQFLRAIGQDPETEDPSNLLLDVETQLNWLGEIGFQDVDCYWKWLELALLIGVKP